MTDRVTDRQTDRVTDRHMNRVTDRQTDRVQGNRRMGDRHMNRVTDRQTDRVTDRQKIVFKTQKYNLVVYIICSQNFLRSKKRRLKYIDYRGTKYIQRDFDNSPNQPKL